MKEEVKVVADADQIQAAVRDGGNPNLDEGSAIAQALVGISPIDAALDPLNYITFPIGNKTGAANTEKQKD